MKTCPKCKTKGIPSDANFCPSCGAQLKDGWFELVHHNDSVELRNDDEDEFIWLTNYTDIYFDVSIKNEYAERFFPHTTIEIPRVKYGTIVAQAGAGWKIKKLIDEDTPSLLMLIFHNDDFVIMADNKQS